MICAIWSLPNLSSHFRENIIKREGITWCSAGKDLQDKLKEEYGIDSSLVIAGVDPNEFSPNRDITKIQRVGLNGLPFINPGWDEIKRPNWLNQIARGIGGESIFIHGKSLSESHTMYDDIDMYICTSLNDRGPYGIAEAAFSKIPVLSTKTGFANIFKSIRTFNTTEEAIQIIKTLNENPKMLNNYIEEVYRELTKELSWSNVVSKYWKPIFENKITLNNSK
jgi:hypothetical protein